MADTARTTDRTTDRSTQPTRAETTGSQWGQAYTFDGFGNLTAKTVTKGSATSWSQAYDPATNLAKPLAVPTGSRAVAFGEGAVWVVNDVQGTVIRIDPMTQSLRSIELPAGAAPSGVAVGGGSGEIRLYNTDTGDRLASLKGFEGGVYSVVFSPSGEQLAAAGFDGKVRIYDAKSGQISAAFVPVPLEKQEVSMVK